jgi:hypothetical protein
VIVVSDTGPLNYLVLIDHVDALACSTAKSSYLLQFSRNCPIQGLRNLSADLWLLLPTGSE